MCDLWGIRITIAADAAVLCGVVWERVCCPKCGVASPIFSARVDCLLFQRKFLSTTAVGLVVLGFRARFRWCLVACKLQHMAFVAMVDAIH